MGWGYGRVGGVAGMGPLSWTSAEDAGVALHGDVGDAEASGDLVATGDGALGLDADRDGGVAVVAHADILPGELFVAQVAGAVAVEPLLAGEDVAEGADADEVVGEDGVEGGGVAARIRRRPSAGRGRGWRCWSWGLLCEYSEEFPPLVLL
ncbi:MAG: hypothetical protein U0841_09580 [Chloroflexia bacterium]